MNNCNTFFLFLPFLVRRDIRRFFTNGSLYIHVQKEDRMLDTE